MNKMSFVIIALICLASAISVYAYDSFKTSGMEVNLITKPIPYDAERRVYTPICLSDCHLVMNVSGIDVKDLYSSDISSFKSQTKGIDDFSFERIEYLKNETYTDTICTSFNNSELHECLATKPIMRWKLVWNPLDTKLLNIKNNYYIDIIYYKKPSLSVASVDVIPIIKSVSIDSMAWFNSSFTKCKNITLTYTGFDSTLTNGNVYLNVTYDSDMQSDYDDLRFVNAGCNAGGTELDYWKEAYNTNYWLGYVEVDSITNTTTKVISMYYGYASATSVSNIVNTFYFGDDFDDGDVTGWTTQNGGTIAVQTTYRLNDSASAYGVQVSGGAGWEVAYKSITDIANTVIKKYTWYVYSYSVTATNEYCWVKNTANNAVLWKTLTTGSIGSYSTSYTQLDSFLASSGKWFKLSFTGKVASTLNWTLDYLNGTVLSATGISPMGNVTPLNRIAVGQDSSSVVYYGDAVFIANYVDKDMTSSFGSEETGGTPTTTTLYINGGVGNITYTYTSIAGVNMTAITDVTGMYVALYVNGTLSGNTTNSVTNTTIFKVGVYNVTAVNYGNSSYYGSSATLWLNITKAPTGMELWLDGTQANRSYSYLPDIPVNSTGVINATGLTVNIYVNNTLKASGTTSKEYDQVFGYGAWNITAMYGGNENYTSSSSTWWLNITLGNNPIYFSIANSTTTLVADTIQSGWLRNMNDIISTYTESLIPIGSCNGGSYNLSINASYGSGINMTNYLNTSFVGWATPTDSYEFYCNGNSNYTTNKSFIYVILNKKDPSSSINLAFNTTDIVSQGTPVLVSCSLSGGSVNLYNDSGSVTNPIIINTTGLVGTYNYTCNTTGNANYTTGSATRNLSVTLLGGVIVNVYDEQSLSSMTFNITLFNASTSVTKYNQVSYQNNSISGFLTAYLWANSYPQRNRYTLVEANGSMTLESYLLLGTSGQYVSFYIQSYQGQPITNSLVEARRLLGSSWNIVDQEYTDTSGIATLFLDYSALHYISIAYGNIYYLINSSLIPSQTLYRYYINPTNITNYTTEYSNLNVVISPDSLSLPYSTQNQAFSCTVTSSDSQLQYYGLNITLPNTSQYFTNTTSTSGGTITKYFNLTNLYYNGQTSLSYDCFFKKNNFSQVDLTLTYYIYNDTNMNVTGLEKSFSEAQGLGFGVMALGIISLVISGIVGGFLGRFNSLAGGLSCILLLGFMWFYLGLFTILPFQIGGIYLLIVLTTVSVIYLRGGI